MQEYRALATGMGGAGIWLEKVSLMTSPLASVADVNGAGDALGGLLAALQHAVLDETALDELALELADLRRKLPPELLGGEEPYDPTDPLQLREVLEDIKSLLVNRLMHEDHAG